MPSEVAEKEGSEAPGGGFCWKELQSYCCVLPRFELLASWTEGKYLNARSANRYKSVLMFLLQAAIQSNLPPSPIRPIVSWAMVSSLPTLRSCYVMLYLLTSIGLTPGGSSTVHIYTQIIHKTTQSTQTVHRTTQLTNWEECGPCPVFASYTLAFALQLRKKHGKTSIRVAEECQLARWKTECTEQGTHNNKNT